MKTPISIIMLILSFAFPGLALAHTGTGEAAGFIHGLNHPISGADHLLAMLAVGLWATQIGGRALWVVPCTFVGVMILGGALGFYGVPILFIEEGIAVSVLILGIFVASAFQLPPLYSAIIVGSFALFHGHAHGAEMPASMGAGLYTVGFASVTAMLHVAGIGLGILMQKTHLQMVTRIAGGAVALSGIYLAILLH